MVPENFEFNIPDFKVRDFGKINADLLKSLEPPLSKINPAEWSYKKLMKHFKTFEDGLDNDHEIGARLVSFGQAVTFHIESMGYDGPNIISFYGISENGESVQLIQHVSQLSVLLVALKKLKDKPRRIGFLSETPKS